MAAPAKTRIAHMVAPGRKVRCRRGVHHGLVPFVDLEGSILGPLVVLDRFRENHISDEGRVRSQPRHLDLVTNRAGNAICRSAVPLWKLLQRKTRKELSVPSRIPVRQPDGWHMADRAFILDRLFRLRMIHCLPPHASLPIRIAGRVSHNARAPFESDRNVLARARRQPVMTSYTPFRCSKKSSRGRLVALGVLRLRLALWHCRNSSDREAQNNRDAPTESHRQPFHNFPSARSQRR